MIAQSDTIAAPATLPGEAGLAVVRLSGPDALAVAGRIFRSRPALQELEGQRFVVGRVSAADGGHSRELDEAVALVYRAPRSYTREDVVEIQTHGGRVNAARILRAALRAGARTAAPGEFTRRAFLNGRIDLTQAEAVLDLVRARSERAADSALRQLRGGLSRRVAALRKRLLAVAAEVEATLDFEEQETGAPHWSSLEARLAAIAGEMDELLATWEEGHVLRDGAVVVIAGRPNVGKSTLFNGLLRMDRSIVSETAGTTRDTVDAEMVVDGLPLRVVDTAGLREARSEVEREGVARARSAAESADLLLYVIDASSALANQDVRAMRQSRARHKLAVLNKEDKGLVVQAADLPELPCVTCSLLAPEGAHAVKDAMRRILGCATAAPHTAISERHRHHIQIALNELNAARNIAAAGNENSALLAATNMQSALYELSRIDGRHHDQDLLDRVFEQFCVGK